MIKLFETGAFLQNGKLVPENECGLSKEDGKKKHNGLRYFTKPQYFWWCRKTKNQIW